MFYRVTTQECTREQYVRQILHLNFFNLIFFSKAYWLRFPITGQTNLFIFYALKTFHKQFIRIKQIK